jgi:hypothetical protein
LTHDDALYKFRLRVFALPEELGSVRAACRAMDIHPPPNTAGKLMLSYGREALRPWERRAARLPNPTRRSSNTARRVRLGHPGFGPKRISAELEGPKWGGTRISPNGVHRLLCRHGLGTKGQAPGAVAGYASPPRSSTPRPIRSSTSRQNARVGSYRCPAFASGGFRDSGKRVGVHPIGVASSHCWA